MAPVTLTMVFGRRLDAVIDNRSKVQADPQYLTKMMKLLNLSRLAPAKFRVRLRFAALISHLLWTFSVMQFAGHVVSRSVRRPVYSVHACKEGAEPQ